MRNKVLGGIGILWGGLIVGRWVFSGMPVGYGPFAAGQFYGVMLGLIMLVAGIYYFRKQPTDKSSDDT